MLVLRVDEAHLKTAPRLRWGRSYGDSQCCGCELRHNRRTAAVTFSQTVKSERARSSGDTRDSRRGGLIADEWDVVPVWLTGPTE